MEIANQPITNGGHPSSGHEEADGENNSYLLWSYEPTFLMPNEMYGDSTSQAKESSQDLSKPTSIQIKSSTDVSAILSHVATKASTSIGTSAIQIEEYNPIVLNDSTEQQRPAGTKEPENPIYINLSSDNMSQVAFTLRSWDAIARAVENNLMLMYFQTSKTDSSFGVLQIHLNVPFTYNVCSPTALRRVMPLRLTRHFHLSKSHESKKCPQFYALILLEALGEIFQDSLLRDVSDTVFQRNTTRQNTDSINHAHEIYNRIDNMHSDEILRYSPGEGESSSTTSTIEPLQIQGLVPTLRPYQEAAVRWMIQREQITAESSYQNSNEWEVAWMVFLSREDDSVSQPREPLTTSVTVSPLYDWMKTPNRNDTGILLYCPFGGWLARSYKEAKDSTLNVVQITTFKTTGGLLAESMGLGKTVETLACILSNKCPNEEHDGPTSQQVIQSQVSQSENQQKIFEEVNTSLRCFCGLGLGRDSSWLWCEKCYEPMHAKCASFDSVDVAMTLCHPAIDDNGLQKLLCDSNRCPLCHETKIRSRATLIITPPAILTQWQREISRHVDDRVSTSIYYGVNKYVHPLTLADNDIVLTTFDTLMSELSHSFENPYVRHVGTDKEEGAIEYDARSLRSKKRYRVVPSPLIRIRWYRIVLDEAQRVESPTALSAKMALQLDAVHRWGVTGTPISRGRLDDLYGLLLFLGLAPFDEKALYTNCFKYSHRGSLDRLSHILRNILWRSTTSNSIVRKQLGLPDREEISQLLTFSSIEKHFYQRQLEATILAASDLEHNSPLTSRSKRPVAKDTCQGVSNELRRLRAACCHPQVGSFGIRAARDKVLSMTQILSLLIDEAKTKAEEAQRVTVLHLIALANLNRLKGEVTNERSFLSTSCTLYSQAVTMGDKNSSPIILNDEVALNGSDGFQHFSVSEEVLSLHWKHQPAIVATMDQSSISIEDQGGQHVLWCSFDFKTPKRISGVLAGPLRSRHNIDETVCFLKPKEIVLEAADGALDGMFVQCIKWTNSSEAIECHTLKSKRWRLRILSFDSVRSSMLAFDTGLELQMTEVEVAVDDLQRLHIYHNLNGLLTAYPEARGERQMSLHSDMNTEAQKLELKYLGSARAAHAVCKSQLLLKIQRRSELASELATHNTSKTLPNATISWWQEILYSFRHGEADKGNFLRFIIDRLNDINSSANQTNRPKFPRFSSIDGLYMALTSRLADSGLFQFDNAHNNGPECIDKVIQLTFNPSEADIVENSLCHNCRQDWGQTGPTCRHCKLERELNDYHDTLNDAELLCVLRSLYDWSRNHMGSGPRVQSLLEEAEKCFEFLSLSNKELDAAKLLWKSHFNLLSDIDEINICKRRPVLDDNHNAFSVTEQAFVIRRQDIDYLMNDHGTKQAMAEAHLRRHLDTVRYLKSLRQTSEDESCSICLTAFDSERAVLRCGHAFHLSPCLQALLNRCGGKIISCPMRCVQRTKREEILVATNKRADDGSRLERTIIGRWGTKVDRLVSDLLVSQDKGIVKSIIFSQWDDMLNVVEQALIANNLHYIRPVSKKTFGCDINRFQSSPSSCSLLMNVKQGAEGLNLTEAKHVFLLEPLINHSLDQQALSRVHRIGQTEKTFVHRYLIKDTIEEKINQIRIFRQVHDTDEPSDGLGRRDNIISAGGLDGGFDIDELKELLS